MKRFKTILLTAALSLSMTAMPDGLYAKGCKDGGCGYEDCRRAPCFSPTYALGTVVLVAVVALLVSHGDSHIHHSHSH